MPFELVYWAGCLSECDAAQREKYLKSARGANVTSKPDCADISRGKGRKHHDDLHPCAQQARNRSQESAGVATEENVERSTSNAERRMEKSRGHAARFPEAVGFRKTISVRR